MINRNNKKGFTIVELVIVIAVIAILAAVLIPTFSSIIAKANQSADISAVTQMNKVLAGNNYKDISEVAKALTENGFNADDTLVPVSKDHAYYWFPEYNTIILVNESEGTWKLIAPTSDEKLVAAFNATTKDSNAFVNLKVTGAKTEADADSFADVLSKGDNVTLTEALNVAKPAEKFAHNGKSAFAATVVPDGETVSIDLGGNALTATTNDTYALGVAGEVHVENGTISSRGIYVYPGGKLVLGENVKVEATGTDGGSAIRNYGGVVIINGGTYTANNAQDIGGDTSKLTYQPAALYCDGGYVEINGGTFSGNTMAAVININNASVIINDCTVTAARCALSLTNCVAEINGGTFTNDGNGSYALYAVCNTVTNVLKINGGTFTNKDGYDVYISKTAAEAVVDVNTSVLTKVADNYYNSAK